ncbi:MAG: hypothetical protein ACI4UU_02380 [Clostridia bacterium]
MKKTFLILLTVIIVLILISSYYIYNARLMETSAQKNNKQYEEYCNKQILGTQLISLINKAIDNNEKNEVLKQQDSIYYENNNKNSIQITVKFTETDRIIKMEDIAEKSTENFVKYFSTAIFECTKVEYHKDTQYIKSLHFEQK